MFEGSSSFVTLTILILAVTLAVFAMKYTVQMLRARTEAARSTDADVRLASVEQKADDLGQRVAHLEALLREVE